MTVQTEIVGRVAEYILEPEAAAARDATHERAWRHIVAAVTEASQLDGLRESDANELRKLAAGIASDCGFDTDENGGDR